MSNSVEQVLAALTPERLQQIILDLARKQAPDDREGVAIGRIMDALTGGQDLGVGSEGWEAYLALQQAIKAAVAHIQGMRYIEADA